jgi:hypothetical protein
MSEPRRAADPGASRDELPARWLARGAIGWALLHRLDSFWMRSQNASWVRDTRPERKRYASCLVSPADIRFRSPPSSRLRFCLPHLSWKRHSSRGRRRIRDLSGSTQVAGRNIGRVVQRIQFEDVPCVFEILTDADNHPE